MTRVFVDVGVGVVGPPKRASWRLVTTSRKAMTAADGNDAGCNDAVDGDGDGDEGGDGARDGDGEGYGARDKDGVGGGGFDDCVTMTSPAVVGRRRTRNHWVGAC